MGSGYKLLGPALRTRGGGGLSVIAMVGFNCQCASFSLDSSGGESPNEEQLFRSGWPVAACLD